MKTATKPPVLDRWWGPFRLRYDQPPESVARSPILSQRCIPMAQERPDGHYFPPGDVTCECGAYPTEMGTRMGLHEIPTRRRPFDPWAVIRAAAVWLLTADLAFAQVLTITTPGTHTLSGPLSGPGPSVIRIEAPNVDLNLNGFAVTCTQPAATGYCAAVAIDQDNVTVRAGALTGGFYGVHAGYRSYITLQDVNLSGNRYIGANLAGGGSHHTVRGVRCDNLGGYTAETYRGCINGLGHNSLVEDLTINELYRGAGTKVGEGVGVHIAYGVTDATIRRYTYTNTTHQLNTMGVWAPSGGNFSEFNFTNVHTAVTGADFDVDLSAFTLDPGGPSGAVAIGGLGAVATNSVFTGYATPFSAPANDGGGNMVTLPSEPPPPPPPPSGTPFRLCLGVGFTQCIEGIIPPPGGVE